MAKAFFSRLLRRLGVAPLFKISLSTLGYLCLTSGVSLAQVTADDTVNTQVNQNGDVSEITGGETRGNNLFHSFRDFSVRTGNEAFFNNATDIANIFSRVIGGNISNINGLIRANGSANLFLINPAGILFGENARLDIGGSFLGSTADSILFEDGEFSATNLDNPPVLTVNAPIGLNFRDNPGDITVRGDGQGTRTTTDLIDTENALRVDSDKTLALVGGKINLEGATLKTAGGRIELGSLQGNEQVSLTPIDKGFGLDFAGVQNFQDHQFSETINATESITLNDSLIASEAGSDVGSNAGELNITTPNLSLTNSSSILVNTDEQGDGGKLSINTANLSLTDFSSIDAGTSGEGNGGSININASESVTLDDSRIGSSVINLDSQGNGGNIQIATGDFSISNNGSINASTSGIGNSGEININANNLSLTNGGNITATTFSNDIFIFAQGNGGNITINVADTLNINDSSSQATGVFASNRGTSTGNAGNIDITTSKLSLINGGQINSFTRDLGNAGNTTINAQDSIVLSGKDTEGFPSGIFNGVEEVITQGNGGTIRITTKNLSLFNAAEIDAFSFGQGDAGLIDIKTNILSLDNNSLITARAFNNDANGGNLAIDASVIVAYPNSNSDILASAGKGEGGNIRINAESVLGIEQRPLNDSTNDINASSQVRGLDGSVELNTPDVNPVQGATQLPTNLVEVKQIAAENACQADRGTDAKDGLVVNGKGGVAPATDQPLTSQNIIVNGEVTSASHLPKPIETSQGKIQLARGVKVTKDGRVILTPYPTNNAGERMPEPRHNCS